MILIRNLCGTLLSIHAELRDLNSKLSSVDQFSTGELTTLLMSTSVQALPAFHERLSAADKRSLAKVRIGAAIKSKEHERDLAESAMENVTCLCHGHLEYFLLHTNANPPLTSYQRAHRRAIGKLLMDCIVEHLFH